MPRRLVQLAIVLVILTCVWGHVSEIFDHWDQTLQTGNDVEFSLVVVALATGVVLALSGQLTARLRTRFMRSRIQAVVQAFLPPLPSVDHTTDASPHLALRI